MAKEATRVITAKPGKLVHGYEFGGPLGTLVLTVILPLVVGGFLLLCNDVSGCPAPSLLSPSTLTLEKLKQDVGWQGLQTIFNWSALYGAFAWYAVSLMLYAILPATGAVGTVLESGGRLKYRFNTFSTAVLIVSVLGAGTIAQGPNFVVWTFIYENYVQLFTANYIISFVLAVLVYIKSYSVVAGNSENRELAAGSNTGNVIYDWFMGRELNPRIKIPFTPEVDIKAWMEMRPGLIGWIMIDLAMAARQWKNFGYVTDSMMLTVACQSIYVFDGLFMESALLTTIDITHDGFGFMLSFGDVVWVPFIYSLPSRYLAVYPLVLGPWLAAIFTVLCIGYYIFRSSNNEKNRFRTNPNDPAVAHIKYIETAQGSKLMVTGWWGRARHINYLGDWTLSWAYCLPTGIAGYQIMKYATLPTNLPADAHVLRGSENGLITVAYQGEAKGWGMWVTYFYMIYFAILLVHRERRLDAICQAKYGKDWDRYRKIVPWRIIPWVY